MSNNELVLMFLIVVLALYLFVQAGVVYELKQRIKRLELRTQLIIGRVDALTQKVLDNENL